MATESQTEHNIKDVLHGYFLAELDFRINFEKEEKSVFENSLFFEGAVDFHTPLVPKKLR